MILTAFGFLGRRAREAPPRACARLLLFWPRSVRIMPLVGSYVSIRSAGHWTLGDFFLFWGGEGCPELQDRLWLAYWPGASTGKFVVVLEVHGSPQNRPVPFDMCRLFA